MFQQQFSENVFEIIMYSHTKSTLSKLAVIEQRRVRFSFCRTLFKLIGLCISVLCTSGTAKQTSLSIIGKVCQASKPMSRYLVFPGFSNVRKINSN